ncbi:MAG: hypothetical protein JWP16_1803 [Alphaproteobacteria bacterium]|nr:hypothetical protein [Alphaproteobacteria bacterium]MDB5740763.1 hypothetical protein [Alphaproteobacteria bacterium]
MPRYFFNVQDSSGRDIEGSELADLHAAKEAAVRLCGEMIREIDGAFWDAPLWRLEVTNPQNRLLFSLTFAAEDHEPA